jgi:hypothetical protein
LYIGIYGYVGGSYKLLAKESPPKAVLLWKWHGLIAFIRLMGKVFISTVYFTPCIMTKNNPIAG